MFSSKRFIVYGLTFRFLIHFELITVFGVRKCSNFFSHSFTWRCPVFPAPLVEEAVFTPLYILASFVKNKVPIGLWVYLLYHWSIALFGGQCHTVLMTVAFYYNLKSGRLIPPAPFSFFKTALAIQGLLCFHMNCEIFCSSSVKNDIGNLRGIALNL